MVSSHRRVSGRMTATEKRHWNYVMHPTRLPYGLRSVSGGWVVVRNDSNKVVSVTSSRATACDDADLLNMVNR